MIRALLARGFTMVAAFDPSPRELNSAAVQELDEFARNHQGFSWIRGVRRGGISKYILRTVRETLNYRRFLLLPVRMPFYESLCFKFLPRLLQRTLRAFPFAASLLAGRPVGVLLRGIEWCAPSAPGILKQIGDVRPCAVLVAFRNRPSSSPDLDYIKAARSLRIPTVVPTPSWDNLSSKGLLQIQPDLLLVWNEEQVLEALEHHGISRAKINMVGAYQFDDWRARGLPRQTRAAFLQNAGIPSEHNYILYLGSGAVTGDSPAVIDELRRGLDESGDKHLMNLWLIVRPAPNNFKIFDGYHRDRVVLFPAQPVSLSTEEGIELFLSSVSYALATVTIHTTGIIDAMLKGVPGMVILRPEYRALQHAEHFAHLLARGAVETVRDGATFARTVRELMAGNDARRAAREAFIREYIFPRGAERSAGEYAALAIENCIENNHANE